MENLKTKLKKIAKGNLGKIPNSIFKGENLKQAVAIESLSYENPATFFKDLSRCGCVSGWVGELISYYDTHRFFDQFYSEIEELRIEYYEQTGEGLNFIKDKDLKNWLAWFGFEETAYQLANEFELM